MEEDRFLIADMFKTCFIEEFRLIADIFQTCFVEEFRLCANMLQTCFVEQNGFGAAAAWNFSHTCFKPVSFMFSIYNKKLKSIWSETCFETYLESYMEFLALV